MDTKGILHHPATWVFIAFILGMVVMYFIATGTISGWDICPKP